MTLLFCVFLHIEGNDPWKNIGLIGVTTFTAGGLFGALFGRSFVRKIRERITDQTG